MVCEGIDRVIAGARPEVRRLHHAKLRLLIVDERGCLPSNRTPHTSTGTPTMRIICRNAFCRRVSYDNGNHSHSRTDRHLVPTTFRGIHAPPFADDASLVARCRCGQGASQPAHPTLPGNLSPS